MEKLIRTILENVPVEMLLQFLQAWDQLSGEQKQQVMQLIAQQAQSQQAQSQRQGGQGPRNGTGPNPGQGQGVGGPPQGAARRNMYGE